MKKIFVFAIVLTIGLASSDPAAAQATEKFWADGEPTFSQTIVVGQGLSVSDVITLEPQYASSSSGDSLGVLLYGLLWSWPRSSVEVISAKDIDYRKVANQELYLVTDALANRVFEYNATEKREVWSFGSNKPGTQSYLDRPVDAFIYKESDLFKILVTDQGRNRVLIVDKESQSVTWYYGDSDGSAGSDPGQLNSPSDAVKILGTDEILIADRGNSRVLIVNETNKMITWEYGAGELNSPVDIEYVPATESVLITDQSQHRVLLVSRADKSVIWQFGIKGQALKGQAGLNAPVDADYLENGNILIADANNDRLIEVDMAGTVVWQFHRPLAALQDADRLPDNRHLIINDIFPTMIGYADSLIALPEMDLGDDQKVIFDRISWQNDVDDGQTRVYLQMRSGNSLSALRDGPWYGPAGPNSYYTLSGQTLNPIHFGHSLYQVRAFLQTSNPLKTPILQSVTVDYHYFNTQKTVVFRTPNLPLTSGPFINRWKKITVHTQLPNDPAVRGALGLDIFVRDAQTDQILAPFSANQQIDETIVILDNYPELLKVPSIYLEGRATTNLPYVTPTLKDWKISWDEVMSSTSALRFVNAAGIQVDVYRATATLPAQESKVDSVRILFSDPDVQIFQNTITLDLISQKSHDSLHVQLELNTVSGFFANRPIPILISDKVDDQNGILEVFDRDTLIVRYVDEDDPTDVSADTLLVVRNSEGKLFIENSKGNQLTTIQPADTLFVRISEENDRNISPLVQEQIRVSVYDNTTGDREELDLQELPSGVNRWDSNQFISSVGLPVILANNGVRNDGKLQTLRGHRITVEYIDNVTLIQTVLVPNDPNTPGGTVNIDFAGLPFIVEVAPNPFFEQQHNTLKMRVAAAFGAINIRYLEVFNLAGEKVRHIDADDIAFDQALPVLKDIYAKSDNWWDLRNENGDPVASGTYFLKVHADITNDETHTLESRAFIRKFVVVR